MIKADGDLPLERADLLLNGARAPGHGEPELGTDHWRESRRHRRKVRSLGTTNPPRSQGRVAGGSFTLRLPQIPA